MIASRGDSPGVGIAWWQALASLVVLSFVLVPFIWMGIISITPDEELFRGGVRYFPPHPTFSYYIDIFRYVNFPRNFLNSTIVATGTTALAIILAVPASYSFARFDFPGRGIIIVSLLLIYMLPGIALLVPLLVIFSHLGLLNTFPVLILGESTAAIPFGVWLLTNFFRSLPRELEEAALIDGCTEIGAMLRVALPLAIPGIVAAGLFMFIGSWNNFTFAFIFTSSEDMRTLPVLLRGFIGGETGLFWGLVMAMSIMTTLPVATAFLVFQRYLVGGLSAGAVKG